MSEDLGDDAERKRGLHCRATRLGKGDDNKMYLCKRSAQA